MELLIQQLHSKLIPAFVVLKLIFLFLLIRNSYYFLPCSSLLYFIINFSLSSANFQQSNCLFINRPEGCNKSRLCICGSVQIQPLSISTLLTSGNNMGQLAVVTSITDFSFEVIPIIPPTI